MFTFTIKPDGEAPFEVEATSRDIVRWEGMNKRNSVGRLTDELRMTDLTDLAFMACDRQGLYAGDVREFRLGVDIEFEKKDADEDAGEDEGDEAGPTRAAR